MAERRLGPARWALIVGLSIVTLGVGLGRSGRLTYHEAFVAQAAREMIARGDLLVPTIGGLPWLEKPPLAFWLVALAGRLAGGISEGVARAPSAVAAFFLVAGVAVFAARRFGSGVGLLAGLIQATTPWTVMRGRLAEVDIVLACLITWAIVAFDRLRGEKGEATASELPSREYSAPEWGRHCNSLGREPQETERPLQSEPAERATLHTGQCHPSRAPINVARSAGFPDICMYSYPGAHAPGYRNAARFAGLQIALDLAKRASSKPAIRASENARPWRWLFFAMLGLTCLAKGVGFGAVLIGAIVALTIAWDRDRHAITRLKFVPGWILAGVLGLTWPILIAMRHPSAVGLWALHVTDRLAAKPEYFIGTPWWQLMLVLGAQSLPWMPLAAGGAARSLGRVFRDRGGSDRLLWTWSVAPLILLSLATVKSPHYAIHALPPWSIWAALGLTRLGTRLQARGWSANAVRRCAFGAFAALGLIYAIGYAVASPRFDYRGTEWAFYQTASRLLDANEPLALLYNVPDWDREPYPSPFGPVPHDVAVRLYYLNRPACWRFGADQLAKDPPAHDTSFAVIGRDSDLQALHHLGRVEHLANGPQIRRDRTYRLFRITPTETGTQLVLSGADRRRKLATSPFPIRNHRTPPMFMTRLLK